MTNNPTIEEKLAQAERRKKSKEKYYLTQAPLVQEFVVALKTPINFHQVVEIFNGLIREQITFEMIPQDVLEEFVLTRQSRAVIKRKQKQL